MYYFQYNTQFEKNTSQNLIFRKSSRNPPTISTPRSGHSEALSLTPVYTNTRLYTRGVESSLLLSILKRIIAEPANQALADFSIQCLSLSRARLQNYRRLGNARDVQALSRWKNSISRGSAIDGGCSLFLSLSLKRARACAFIVPINERAIKISATAKRRFQLRSRSDCSRVSAYCALKSRAMYIYILKFLISLCPFTAAYARLDFPSARE